MASTNYNKEIIRACENTTQIRMDVHFVSRFFGIVMLVLSALLLAGMGVNFFSKNATVKLVSLIVILAGVGAVAIIYLALRIRGPLTYTIFSFDDLHGERTTFQIFGKRKIYACYRGVTLTCKRGEITKCASMFKPELNWDWWKDANFTQKRASDARTTRYDGQKKGKFVLLSIKDGSPYYGEVGGARVHYYERNNITRCPIIPASLATALSKLGASLPNFIRVL